MSSPSTIAAIATPPGRGGVGIVRVSGPRAPEIARAILGHLPAPRFASLREFRDANGAAIDEGLALYFPAPHSFTGEDVLELHGHGGPVVLDMLLQRLVALGARLARPGEFSERAFLNDKLDLSQAEAVADLIDSGSASAARSALRSLQGEFSRRINVLVALLTELRTFVEAAIDFPEEEIDFLNDARVLQWLDRIEAGLRDVLAGTRQGCLLREGMTVALAGEPNVGKSSLLNRLAEHDAAIVSDVPGTTRDLLRHEIQLDGLPLHIIDTAGLREAGDAIESEGIRRARAAIETADRILLITDAANTDGAREARVLAELPGDIPCTIVRNKIDLTGQAPGSEEIDGRFEVALSAKTGAGLDTLRHHLENVMGYEPGREGLFTARRRHLDAIERAQARVLQGRAQLESQRAGELLAEELRLAQQDLGEITGEVTSEDLLGRIFSSFCIGK